MSYRCRTGQCDGNPGGTCSRTQMFSNSVPAYTVNGCPIGNAQNDNARKIDESKSIIAGYYPFQETCQADADCTTSDACNPGVCDGVCSFPPLDCKCQVVLDRAMPVALVQVFSLSCSMILVQVMMTTLALKIAAATGTVPIHPSLVMMGMLAPLMDATL